MSIRDATTPPDRSIRDVATPRDLAIADRAVPLDLGVPDWSLPPDQAGADSGPPPDLAIRDGSAPPDLGIRDSTSPGDRATVDWSLSPDLATVDWSLSPDLGIRDSLPAPDLAGLDLASALDLTPGDLAPVDGPPPCPRPDGGAWATFAVGAEYFRAQITDPGAIVQAFALWRGQSQATIPVGTLVCRPVPWNCPWSWHLDPPSLRFAPFAIELCDGTPSHVEARCVGFGGAYCPWRAKLIDLRDCRTDADCPVVAK